MISEQQLKELRKVAYALTPKGQGFIFSWVGEDGTIKSIADGPIPVLCALHQTTNMTLNEVLKRDAKVEK